MLFKSVRNITLSTCAFVAMLIAACTTAQARDPKGLVGVGVDAGIGMIIGPDWVKQYDSAIFVPGVHGRYHVTSNFAVQGAFRYLKHFESGQRGYVGEAALQYWLSPDAIVSPVFGLGIGFTRVTGAVGVKHDTSFINLSVSPSIGIEGWLSQCTTLGFLVRYHGVLANVAANNELHTVEPTLALTWYFGGAKHSDVATASVVHAPANPRDSDGDGVYDSDDKCPNTPQGESVNSFGCPKDEKASFKLNVNFDSGSDHIKAASYREIADLAAFLSRHGGIRAVVEGHTDNTGVVAKNKDLSLRRAQAVVNRLMQSHGISPDRLKAEGFGSEKPVADNSTVAGRGRNRRVVVTVEE